jgi:5'-nucleotidase
MITRIQLDRSSGSIAAVAARNEIVTRDVEKDPVQTRILARYSTIAERVANRVVGSAAADIERKVNDAGESALGDVIADAQLAATSAAAAGGARISFTNIGGIRSELVFPGGRQERRSAA